MARRKHLSTNYRTRKSHRYWDFSIGVHNDGYSWWYPQTGCPDMKRDTNRKVRRYYGDISNGGSYKKLVDTWAYF